jgi:hypothetical protein
MSCQKCDDFQEQTNRSYYFRWGLANIEVRACEFHVKQVFDCLKKELARLGNLGQTLELEP